jgi:hypothetical protein
MRLYDEIADAMEAEAREQTADGRLSRAAVLQDWAARIRAMAPARDESVPPPGWNEMHTSRNVERGERICSLANSWAIYDGEHGYAPDHARFRALAERMTTWGNANGLVPVVMWADELLALLEDKR